MTADENAAAKDMIQAMATIQNGFNARVNGAWRSANYEWYRAAWVECGELLDHIGWKWWAPSAWDPVQARFEVVDIWCFCLSELMINREALKPCVVEWLNVPSARAAQNSPPDLEKLRQSVESLARDCLQRQAVSAMLLGQVMENMGMPLNELFRLHVGKSTLNRFRQDRGYREGTYRKVWNGREDNRQLADILLIKPPPEVCDPETAEEAIYAKLDFWYRELA